MSEKVKKFFKKYFLEGQKLDSAQIEALEKIPDDATAVQKIIIKHRKLIGIMIPLVTVQFLWWTKAFRDQNPRPYTADTTCYCTNDLDVDTQNCMENFTRAMTTFDPNLEVKCSCTDQNKYICNQTVPGFFEDFQDKYVMTITMIFGAMVAGMTSEGGGAVSFPVMTLALKVDPRIARDYAFMLQSIGMGASMFTILWMRIKLEYRSIVFCSLGAFLGLIFGLEVLDELLCPVQKKLGFVTIWFSFAFALYLLNREQKRTTFDEIPNCGPWKAGVLLIAGFFGGTFTGIAGSGVDICSFSILTLLFRVSEKVATPTSVVLMAINTCAGFYWRDVQMGGVEPEAWGWFKVCVPIVVIFAPLGSIIASYFHRQVLAWLVYVLDTLALITALIVLADKISIYGGLAIAGIMIAGFLLFSFMAGAGKKLLEKEQNSRPDLQVKEIQVKQ